MFFYRIGSPNLLTPTSTNVDMGMHALQAWLWGVLKVDMQFENGFHFPLEVFYKAESGEGHISEKSSVANSQIIVLFLGAFQGTVQPGKRMSMGYESAFVSPTVC
jgi:hypothetical protein